MLALLAMIGSLGDHEVRIHIDLLEHNTTFHIHTDQGAGPGGTDLHRLEKAGEYWNFWRFYPEEGRYHVMDFRGVGKSDRVMKRPDGYHLLVKAPYRNYHLIARIYLETRCFAEEDPEVLDKKRWGQEKRQEIPGIRWGPLTSLRYSDTFMRSHERSTSWERAIRKDVGSSIRFEMPSWIMGSSACDPLVARAVSISWPGKKDWSSLSSARGMGSSLSGSGIAWSGMPVTLGRFPSWPSTAEECYSTLSPGWVRYGRK